MKSKNFIWVAILAIFVGAIGVFAQDQEQPNQDQQNQEQQNQDLQNQDQQNKDLENQDQQNNLPKDQEGQLGQDQQGVTTISGTIYCVPDASGKASKCEIRDERGTSFVIHAEGLGKDLLDLSDARIRATGRMMGEGGEKTFHIESYEATVGIAGKLIEKDDESVVLEEISFQNSPRHFRVLNRKEEIQNLGVPFDKEIKANGTVVKGSSSFIKDEGKEYGTMPEEGVKPEDGTMPEEGVKPEDGSMPQDGTKPEDSTLPEDGSMPQEGVKPEDSTLPQEGVKPEDSTLPQEGVKPEDSSLPQDQAGQDQAGQDQARQDQEKLDAEKQAQFDRERMDREKQAGFENQAGLDKASSDWTIRITSYEPLEYVVGVVSVENADAENMQIRLQEEEKGIIFKEKGRTFDVDGKGKGMALKEYEGKKIKAYGTLTKGGQGNWLLHVLAYQLENAENLDAEKEDVTEEQKDVDAEKKDVEEENNNANKDVEDAKTDANEDIREEQKDVQEEQKDVDEEKKDVEEATEPEKE
jgi:hypothetical protein